MKPVAVPRHHLTDPISFVHGHPLSVGQGVNIDLSGPVEIGDRVILGTEALIFTHRHDPENYWSQDKIKPTPLVIEDDVFIGARAIIIGGVGRIGRGARIGAGSVVIKEVPPGALVSGNPAQVIQ